MLRLGLCQVIKHFISLGLIPKTNLDKETMDVWVNGDKIDTAVFRSRAYKIIFAFRVSLWSLALRRTSKLAPMYAKSLRRAAARKSLTQLPVLFQVCLEFRTGVIHQLFIDGHLVSPVQGVKKKQLRPPSGRKRAIRFIYPVHSRSCQYHYFVNFNSVLILHFIYNFSHYNELFG